MVKCSQCGFLALRNVHDGSLVEAPSDYRSIGGFELYGQKELLDDAPYCFVRVWDIFMECVDIHHSLVRDGRIKAGSDHSDATIYVARVPVALDCTSVIAGANGFNGVVQFPPKPLQDHLGHASSLMTLRYLSTLQEEDSLRIQQDVQFD